MARCAIETDPDGRRLVSKKQDFPCWKNKRSKCNLQIISQNRFEKVFVTISNSIFKVKITKSVMIIDKVK